MLDFESARKLDELLEDGGSITEINDLTCSADLILCEGVRTNTTISVSDRADLENLRSLEISCGSPIDLSGIGNLGRLEYLSLVASDLYNIYDLAYLVDLREANILIARTDEFGVSCVELEGLLAGIRVECIESVLTPAFF